MGFEMTTVPTNNEQTEIEHEYLAIYQTIYSQDYSEEDALPYNIEELSLEVV
jgi:hypothetical protein